MDSRDAAIRLANSCCVSGMSMSTPSRVGRRARLPVRRAAARAVAPSRGTQNRSSADRTSALRNSPPSRVERISVRMRQMTRCRCVTGRCTHLIFRRPCCHGDRISRRPSGWRTPACPAGPDQRANWLSAWKRVADHSNASDRSRTACVSARRPERRAFERGTRSAGRRGKVGRPGGSLAQPELWHHESLMPRQFRRQAQTREVLGPAYLLHHPQYAGHD